MEFVAKHNRVALAAAKAYAKNKPWQGEFSERVEKIRDFHANLNDAYDVSVGLIVDTDGNYPAQAGGFLSLGADVFGDGQGDIVLRPGFAIMTYLRLFAEALEYERDLVHVNGDDTIAGYVSRWANGMFKKAFPKSWDRLVERNAPILTRDYA